MAVPYSAFGGGVLGQKSAAIGTVYYHLVPPYRPTPTGAFSAFTVIFTINQLNGNTANMTTIMRPLAPPTTCAVAATTSGNTITLAADPGPTGNGIAANDVIVTANTDGTFSQYVIGAWNATTKVATVVVANLAKNVAAGNKVWDYGIFSDTDPLTGVAFPGVTVAVNTTANAFAGQVSGFRAGRVGEPLLLYNPNATGQTILNYVEYAYSNV